MIKKLSIKNFQSHKDSELIFHKGVNMIIGGSDKGKSAIFNSLLKVITNRPVRGDWQSWWGGVTKIKVKVDNFIITYKKKTKAEYIIKNLKTKKETIFSAFGSSVPEEVNNIFNIDQKINIQRQMEKGAPIFLISESPGEVAKHFNTIAHLDIIDKAKKRAKEDINLTTNALNKVKEQLLEKINELEKYEYIPALEERVTHLNVIQEEIFLKKEKLKTINKLLQKINTYIEEKKYYEKIISIKPKVIQFENVQKELKGKIFTATKIKLKKDKLKKLIIEKEKLKEINKIIPLVNILQEKINISKEKNKKIEKINYLFQQIAIRLKNTVINEKEINKLKETFKKEMPTICPLCGDNKEKK